MMGLFSGAKPTEQPTDPTDTVIPLYDFDDNSIYRNVLLYITLRFDDVLDPEKLRQSLERLMEIGDWRKLGARIRKTVTFPALKYQNHKLMSLLAGPK
jgi:hypothetical protein